MKHDVTFQREDYEKSLYAWSLVDDVVDGQSAVKDKRTLYLPKPNPSDTSSENRERYDQYLARAVFYNATGRTLSGLVGASYRKDPSLNVPSVLDYVSDDIDGAGISIYQQSQSVLKAVLKRGRHALLADYPQVGRQSSRADMVSGRIRSTVVSIRAEQITNWRTKKVGAEHKLSLVVISEHVEEETPDGFGVDIIHQYRVLRLNENYTQEVWRKANEKWVLFQDPIVILDGSGKPWDEIPLAFVGSNNNDTIIDQSPLYDMAEINIAHYRNSADYEDSAYFVGQAQPWMSGLTEEWRNWMEANGVYVGSRSPVLLPEGGSYGIAQAAPNTLVREAMQDKEKQLIALGARLVSPGSAIKTATEAQGEQEAEHSVLSLACSNVSEAYTKVLEWMARFMAAPESSIEFEVQRDFIESKLDPQMLTALIGAWQSGQLPESDLWGQLRKYGVIDPEKDDESIKQELESQSSGLGLDAV